MSAPSAAALDALDVEQKDPHAPGLAESIETRRFLGREFLAWLWFESEAFEQRFSIDGFGECDLWLERSIAFEAVTEGGREKASLAGVAPSGGPVAREALRSGKLPTRAKIAIRREEQDFSFVFDADLSGLPNVKIPALLKGTGDDPFYERIALVEELEAAVEALYKEFLLLRLPSTWARDVLPAMRSWMQDEESLALNQYRTHRVRHATPPAAKPAGKPARAGAST